MRVPIKEGPSHPFADRAIAVTFILLACGFVYALWSIPVDARGYGTHEALGMTPCRWPEVYGYPCPTCGVTTAATQLVHGRPLASFLTQPFGFTLAASGLSFAGLALWSLLRRESFVARIAWLPYGRVMIGAVVLLFAAWGYKALTFS